MKKCIILALMGGSAVVCLGQTNRFPPINLYTGDPTGNACSGSLIQQSTTTGLIYTCQSGTMHTGGSSSSITPGSGYRIPAYPSGSAPSVSPSNIAVDATGNNLSVPGSLTATGGADIQNSSLMEELPNNNASGATLNALVCMNGSAQAQTCTTASTMWTGLAVGGATGVTVGNTLVARTGQGACLFDGTTVIGHYATISVITNGDCHDTGASTYPTTGAVIGRVLTVNGGAGTTAIVNLYSPGISASGTFNGGTVTNAINMPASVTSGLPTPDMRSPSFASGSLCNDSFDNAPAFNAMLSALPIKGGRTQIIGGFAGGTSCRIMPTNITWPASTGPVNIYIQGKVKVGTTLWLNKPTTSSGAPINLLGFAGGTSTQFQTTIEPANIELSPSSGTCMGLLGTAVSTTEGTGLQVTFTPSTPPSSNPCLQVGTWMTIADTTDCTISTISRTSNIVTAVFSASCHVLQGTPITLAGVTDTSFNSGVVFTGQLTSGSPTVTFSSGSPLAGQWIRATNVVSGIPSSTYIVSVGAGTLTMSNNATNSNSISLTTNTFDFNNVTTGFFATSSDWCGDASHACQMTWKQPGPDATSSGGTLTAFTPDTIEHVPLTAITSTTATATFFRSHSATAQFGVDAIALGNDGTGSTADISAAPNIIRDISIINPYGTCLTMAGAYKAVIDKSGCFTGGPFNSGNYANWALEIVASSYVTINDSAFTTNGPYSIHMTQRWNDGAAGSGPLYMTKDFFTGIYMDHGASGLSIVDSSTEHAAGSLVTFNVANYWNGNPTWYKLDNVNSQDAYLSNGALYYIAPSYSLSQGGTTEMRNVGIVGCLVNSYYKGKLNNVLPGQNKWDCLNVETRGIVGTFNDGKNTDGSNRGSGANFSPSVIPHATVAVTAPGTWTGCSTITTGQPGPDGLNNATLLTNTSSTCSTRIFQSGTITPAKGDQVLFGGWEYTPTLDLPVNLGGSTFLVDNSGSGNWSFTGVGGQQITCDIYDSLLLNDWWHPVVCYGRVISVANPGVTTGAWRMFLTGSAGINKVYAYPWAMYIPASEGISQTEVMRWRAQLLHGYVPPSAVAGKSYTNLPISLPADPVASLDAATKHYVDTAAAGITGPVSSTIGDCVNWADTLGKVLNDAGLPCSSGGGGTTLLEYVTPGIRTGGTAFVVNATRLYSLQIIGGSITATKFTYQLSSADNTANLYDVGFYSATGTLLCHLGATAGTTFSPSASTFTLSIASCPTFTAGTRYLLGITTNCAASCAQMYGVGANLEAVGNAAPSAGSVTAGGVLNGSITPPADSWAGNPSMPQFSLHN